MGRRRGGSNGLHRYGEVYPRSAQPNKLICVKKETSAFHPKPWPATLPFWLRLRLPPGATRECETERRRLLSLGASGPLVQRRRVSAGSARLRPAQPSLPWSLLPTPGASQRLVSSWREAGGSNRILGHLETRREVPRSRDHQLHL